MPAEVMKFAERARQGIRAWWRRVDGDGYDLINPYSTATEAYRQIGEYYPYLADIPPLKVNADKYTFKVDYECVQITLPNGKSIYYYANTAIDVPDQLIDTHQIEIGGIDVPVDMRAIIRPPVPEDNEWCSFGVVSPQYTLLTPNDSVELYDTFVRDTDGNIVPVETIGALQRGKIFFISTQLPDTSVRGDHIQRHMLIACPMDGVSAAEVLLTDVRVVCMNTYRAALNSAKERFVVQHHSKVKEHFGAWMSFLYGMVTEKAAVLQEVYDILANKQVTQQDITWIANSVYGTPDRPNPADYPQELFDQQVRNWERLNEGMKVYRDTFYSLFEGGAIGADSEAFKGTAYGAFQSIVQMENQGGQFRGTEGRMNQILFGTRNANMQRAYAAVVKVAQGV